MIMKRFVLVGLMVFLCGFVVNTRTVTGTSTTIATADNDFVILHTGAAATYTLGTVSDGFSCRVVNHGTGNITFSGAVTVANGQTITVLGRSASEMLPGVNGNSITLVRIGGVWRGAF
jgi:hypothetical protein